MSNTILLKRSSVSGKVPLTTDLSLGELAINTYDGKAYIKMNNGADAIVELTKANLGNVTGTLVVANGGTGATTLTGYVKGNGTSAMTASSTVPGSDVSGNIAGNAANVTGTVAVANGGTGQTTANAALNALLPSQTGNSTKVLSTDGTNTAWTTVASGGSGTVTSVSVTSANGLAGTVATSTSTPAITLSTTVTGIVKGNGTSLSAAVAADFPTLNQNTTGTAANVTGTVALANGGTGATTQAGAANAVLPTQASNSGKFLTTDGTNVSWATAGGGGSTTPTCTYEDDFMSGWIAGSSYSATAMSPGQGGWSWSIYDDQNSDVSQTSATGHPGILSMGINANNDSGVKTGIWLGNGSGGTNTIAIGDVDRMTYVVRILDPNATFLPTSFFGMFPDGSWTNTNTPTEGICFAFGRSSAGGFPANGGFGSSAWQVFTGSTLTSTGVTMVQNNWYVLDIVRNRTSGNWEYYMNGVLKNTVSSPADSTMYAVGAMCGWNYHSSNGTSTFQLDYFKIQLKNPTARYT